MQKTIAKTNKNVYDDCRFTCRRDRRLGLKQKIKKSKFTLSFVGFTGYALYTAYAVYYYLSAGRALGIVLLCLIAVAFSLSVALVFISYRVNLMDKPRPALLRFMKTAKYAIQLLCSLTSLGMIITAVQSFNALSLIMALISIPFLLWSIAVNLVAEFVERKLKKGFGKRVYVRVPPKDEEGNPVDVEDAIARVDGARKLRQQREREERRKNRYS